MHWMTCLQDTASKALDLAEERNMLTADKCRGRKMPRKNLNDVEHCGIDMPKANVDYEQQQKLMDK